MDTAILTVSQYHQHNTQRQPSLKLLAFIALPAKQHSPMTMLNLFKRSTVQANFLSLCPLEQFEFVSQRHRGYPFSATLYVNGIVVSRISSCCEYRYAPGFQQGRKSCFRLTWLAGGLPCYRLDFILCERIIGRKWEISSSQNRFATF